MGDRLARGGSLAVVGEAGVGKTELVREAAAASRRRVYEGGGLASLSFVSYFPLTRALGREPAGGDAQAVAFEVASTVDGGVLILDDLHWSDPDTLRLLSLLAGRVRLLAAIRRGDRGAAPALEAARDAGFDVLELGGLGEDDAGVLVRSQEAGLDEAQVRAVVARAGGNPLLLAELARGGLSETLALSVRARLRRATPEAREALVRLALLARPGRAELLGPGASELIAAGLAVEDGEGLSVRHGLIGEAALELLDGPTRRQTHAQLARLLEDAGEAARHHAEAGELRPAHAKALAAAEAARTPGERARYLGLAAACAGEGEAAVLRLSAADALVVAGDYQEALRLLERFDEPEAMLLAEAHLHRARAFQSLAAYPEAVGEVEAGLTLVGGSGSGLEARLRVVRAMLALWDLDPGLLALAEEALALAVQTGTDVARARSYYGNVLAHTDAPGCMEELLEARRLARASGEHDVELHAEVTIGLVLEGRGELPEARKRARRAIARARQLRLRGPELEQLARVAHFDFRLDGPSAALAECYRALFEEPGHGWSAGILSADYATVLADLGRDEDARSVLARFGGSLDSAYGREAIAMAEAEVHWAAGRLVEAVEAADAVLGEPGYNTPYIELARGWALAELGRPVPAAGEFSLDPYIGLALAGLAAIVEPGREAEAEELLAEAAELAAGRELRERLRCLWGAGEAARRTGALERARERLLAVEERAQALGMEPLLRRIHRSLRLCGVYRATARARGGGSLTAREREVLALVGDGLTSGQVAGRLGTSPSTVDAQVASAMRKLGARTRRQAVALMLAEQP